MDAWFCHRKSFKFSKNSNKNFFFGNITVFGTIFHSVTVFRNVMFPFSIPVNFPKKSNSIFPSFFLNNIIAIYVLTI